MKEEENSGLPSRPGSFFAALGLPEAYLVYVIEKEREEP